MDRNLERQIEEVSTIGEWVVFLRALARVFGVADDDPRLIKVLRDFRERPYYVVYKDIFGQEIVMGSASTPEEAIKLAKELTSERIKDTDPNIFYYTVCGPGFEQGLEIEDCS